MDEILRRAVIILRGMWKHRLLGLVTAWVVGVAGVGAVVSRPDKYEATARIFVNTDSIIKPLMAGMAVQPNIDQRIDMLSRVVLARPNVEKLVHMVGLDSEAPSKGKYDQIVDDVSKELQIKSTGSNNQYTLSYRARSPELAKRMVEALLSTFVESGQGAKSSDTDAAKKFIDDQIAINEKKLEDAENRVKEFKLRNLGVNVGAEGDYFTRMTESNNLLSQAQLELRQAENSRDAYKRELDSLQPTLTQRAGPAPDLDLTGKSIADLDARIDALKRNLDLLLQKYTDGHPDVLGTRRSIKDLEDQRAQLMANRKQAGIPVMQSSTDGPRAYEQLKVSLATAEAQVASTQAKVAEYTSRAARLRELAKQIPQLEAESAQLNRDYEVDKKNYESLVTRRESASLSGDMQSVSGVVDFRLVDPPRATPKPVAPNRLLLLAGALVAALGAGIAAAFIAAEVRPTFYDARTLRESTGLPILGVVSLVSDDAAKRRARTGMLRFLAGLGALFVAYASGFVVLALLTARTAQALQ